MLNMDSLSPSTSLQARKDDTEGTYSDIVHTDHVDVSSIEKEHMFNKVVTPSDVGKLNRLVIPKQHAEKYFPLNSSTNEKGLHLNFEDKNGKPWRFRYSYWNSSQSYVMTKGWSRFVKEKQLDAGDVVSFERGVGELAKDRLFIDWRRRRPDAPVDLASGIYRHGLQFQPWNIRWSGMYPLPAYPPLQSMPVLHQMGGIGHGIADYNYSMVIDSVPVVQGKSSAKRLRLFGVNMDCPTSVNDDELECNVLGSSVLPSHPFLPCLGLRVHSETSHTDQIDQEELSDKGKSSLSLDLDL